MIVVRVIDRTGKPLAGYHVHYGQDGGYDKWDTTPTTESTKEPFGYNSSFALYSNLGFKFYVTVFQNEIHPYDIGQSLSNEVIVNIDPKDDAACAASGNKTDGTAVRVAPVVFTYNR